MELKQIVNHFISDKIIQDIQPFGNGHINSTYKVSFKNSGFEYILQKINTSVFKSPAQIIQNHIKLQEIFKQDTGELTLIQDAVEKFIEIGSVGMIENCFSFSNALLCFAQIGIF
ncbi:MAG: hypothetical protein ACLFVR_15910 [Thiohalospira sp.]